MRLTHFGHADGPNVQWIPRLKLKYRYCSEEPSVSGSHQVARLQWGPNISASRQQSYLREVQTSAITIRLGSSQEVMGIVGYHSRPEACNVEQ